MNRAYFISFLFALTAWAFTSQTVAASPPDDSAIRAAAVADKPIIIAKVLDSRMILRGTRSQQLDYRIEVLQILSGNRKPEIDSVAHYSSDSLETRLWNRGWIYVFVFDRPDATMPLYHEPLSRFGNRKAQIIQIVQSLKRNGPT
jgi:hypothetical protein